MPAYRYVLTYPRIMDAPRPNWPIEIIDRVRQIPGLVDATFPDLTAAWHDETGGDDCRRESHRQIVRLDVDSPKPADVKIAQAAVRDFAVELKTIGGHARVIIARWPIEIEVA